MVDKNAQDWGNDWQGRAGDRAGEALVGVGIEHNEKLAEFWAECFAGLDKSSNILDMACGAGSVLRHANANGFTHLSGVDISGDAVAAMQREFPNAKGIVAPVDDTGLADGAYDLVVSQYGFEYAGSNRQVLAAAREMARLVADNGQFIALCHIKGGGIEQEVSGHLRHIKDMTKPGFISAAKAVFIALDAAEKSPTLATKTAYEKATHLLTAPRDKLIAWLGAGQTSGSEIHKLGQHLYSGTIDLFTRRKAYSLADITGWLDCMQNEIDAYRGRMQSMRQSALSEKDSRNILAVFADAQFNIDHPAPFYLAGDNKPAAWVLRARR
ncbi:MAG: class I SAM-dependent methyltransferase [Robiginitomaculum sp.]|nr:class I SAM-dependent methyltransferase [Robiginitomaculum sp.]